MGGTATLLLLTFGIVLLAVLGMAVGVIARNRPIHAGCGRFPAGKDDAGACPACDGSCAAEGRSESRPSPSARGQA